VKLTDTVDDDPDSDTSDIADPEIEDAPLPWINRLDQLHAELTSVLREQQMLDVSVLSAFADANRETPTNDEVVADARAMMDAGFEAFQGKLRRQRELQESAMRILDDIHHERAKHPPSEFGADVDPRFDPDLDLADDA
jgi:hypothetical protein